MQLEPLHEPEIYLYHCDHRGLPLALMGTGGETVWPADYD